MRFLKFLTQSPDGLLHSVVDDAIAAMTQATTVEDGAIAFINSVPAMIQAAIDKATNGGATAAQLAPFVALNTDLTAKSDALQAALLANTPAAPPAGGSTGS